MSKTIEIDDYLLGLSKDIRHDDSIKDKLYVEEKVAYVDDNYLRDQANFYSLLGIELRKVNVLVDDIEICMSPIYIPIKYTNRFNSSINGVIDNSQNFYSVINICDINSTASRINYIHELAHTQVNEFDNLEDEYNNELMPLLMELIYSDYIGYDNRVNDRLYELNAAISFAYDPTLTFENKKYIKSLLQALKLYRMYNGSDNYDKKEMIYNISLLFNKDISLEDFLSIYDVNYNNSKVALNVLKRNK